MKKVLTSICLGLAFVGFTSYAQMASDTSNGTTNPANIAISNDSSTNAVARFEIKDAPGSTPRTVDKTIGAGKKMTLGELLSSDPCFANTSSGSNGQMSTCEVKVTVVPESLATGSGMSDNSSLFAGATTDNTMTLNFGNLRSGAAAAISSIINFKCEGNNCKFTNSNMR